MNNEIESSSSSEYEIVIDISHGNNNIIIENIQEEKNLIDYTENHYINKFNKDFDQIKDDNIFDEINFQNNYLRSNSPVTISNNGSRSNSDSETDNDFTYNKYKQLSFNDIEKNIEKYYDLNVDNKYSSEIDILTTYVKGQKNLFIQAKHLTQRKLNCLMFPSIFITAFIAMMSPFIECKDWSREITSALNALIMLLISLVSYLKLESAIEVYMHNVKQYDKLEFTLELTNNKLLFIDNDKEKNLIVLNKIKDIEKKMNEIKESTNLLIPEEIKRLFPIICHINVFSCIKKIEIYKKNLIVKFKDVKNEIRYILYKWNKNNKNDDSMDTMKEKNRIQFLYDVKNKLKEELLDFRSAYSQIDSIFTKEIKNADKKTNEWSYYLVCFFNRAEHKSYSKGLNPVIDKYFQYLFVDE